jgi:hypothetical protein
MIFFFLFFLSFFLVVLGTTCWPLRCHILLILVVALIGYNILNAYVLTASIYLFQQQHVVISSFSIRLYKQWLLISPEKSRFRKKEKAVSGKSSILGMGQLGLISFIDI